MPSITYWSRLEPRPRAPTIADTLAARVRDPLWLLARQWQFGEFHGEDAGSLAFAQVTAALGDLTGWSAQGSELHSLPPGGPLEPAVLSEDASGADLSLAVELGQVFEQALADLGRPTLIDAFRDGYRMEVSDGSLDTRDEDALRFLELASGRCTHGVNLFLAAERALPNLPTEPPLDPGDEGDVRTALERLRSWVRQTIGRIGEADAESWVPERLEYALQVAASGPNQEEVSLSAHPDHLGSLEWYAFDTASAGGPAGVPADGIKRVQRSIIPGSASFRGMPNARWWAFESGMTNLGAIRPEQREVAKLIVMDFMLVHSNDWYVFPFPQPMGTLCYIESLVVHDVFGGATLIGRAAGRGWTMFSTAVEGTSGLAGFFLMPPTVGPFAQSADPVEEVRFVRDEMANMAWGVERVTQNAVGEPWPADERALTGVEPSTGSEAEAPSLRYRIQTTVPEHWIPFLPVAIEPAGRQIMLERSVLLRSAADPPTSSAPAGRILRPSRLGDAPYRIEEEELPRTALRVARTVHRSRWTDGSTVVWITRHTESAANEGRSGLQFDVANGST